METMTPKTRLLNRLEGKEIDRIPNLSIVMQFAAAYTNIKYGDFCRDYRCLVEAQSKTAQDFGIDILSTMSDAYREAYDYGAAVRFVEDDLPICEGAFLQGPEDIVKLKAWNPLDSVRMLDRIRAVELFHQQSGKDYPILGWVEGPWAEFTDLTTLTEGMMLLYDEPEFTKEAMTRITQQAISCALEQIKAGADIIGIGDAAASLVSEEIYREFILPLETELVQAIHLAGGKTKLHICGDINHLLPAMLESKSDIIDIDYMVDMAGAITTAKGQASICGNINPVDIILQSSPERIQREVQACASISDNKSIVSSGCEVPRNTPPENLKAVIGALSNKG